MAIYKGDTKIADSAAGMSLSIDTELSPNSTNPVQNKAISEAMGYSWVKPADWVDIRSGAAGNSVHFLVAHSVPTESGGTYSVATYPDFKVYAEISNSGTYDVFVDGIKVATTASGTATTVNWATLYNNATLQSGYDVTYPSTLTTHRVQITPTSNTNKINWIRQDNGGFVGVLWVHFTLTNTIKLTYFLNTYNASYTNICEAVTSNSGELVITANTQISGTFAKAPLKTVPIINLNNGISNALNCFRGTTLKKIIINNGTILGYSCFHSASSLKEIDGSVDIEPSDTFLNGCTLLKTIPSVSPFEESYANNNFGTIGFRNFLNGCTSLQEVFLNLSGYSHMIYIGIGGTSSKRIDGLKGFVVSSSAPFSGSSPQIDVSYTGLDRAALIQLFKSMPYNVGYTVVGSPTITDGVASGFSGYPNPACLSLPETADFSKPFHIHSEFTPTVTNFGVILGRPGNLKSNVYLQGIYSDYCRFAIFNSSSNTAILDQNIAYDSAVVTGNKHALDIIYNGTDTYSIKLENMVSSVVLVDSSITTTAKVGSNTGFTLGATKSDTYYVPFQGSIDLNETYIKVNGVPWFTGKAAMTKACSIVGCTGTADLTQADKDIALDKGWSLTVA